MKKTSYSIIALLAAFCGMVCSPAYADWINLSGAENAPNIAEIYINDDHVKVQLEIFVNDIMVFDRLIPDEFFKDSGIQRPSAEDRIRLFAKEDLQIIADGKKHLMARLEVVDTRMRTERYSPMAGKINPYTRQLIPGPPEDKRVLYAEIIYPFTGKPESLTFIPSMDEKGFSKAAIGFTAY